MNAPGIFAHGDTNAVGLIVQDGRSFGRSAPLLVDDGASLPLRRSHDPLLAGPSNKSCGTNKLRVLDLFSGIGGFSLGLERTGGFQTTAFCELQAFQRRVLSKHWPEVPIYHDVRELNSTILQRDQLAVDVICGGFPCQDVSIAGRGAGIDGARTGLWRESIRLVSEIAPEFVILENVPKIRSRGLERLLSAFDEVGYDAEWHCIPAAYVGAPHRRDRVWVIAYRQGHAFGSDADHIRRKCTSTEALNFETNKSVSLDRWLGGVPNPRWSEWLMGFPQDWTSPE